MWERGTEIERGKEIIKKERGIKRKRERGIYKSRKERYKERG